MTQTKPARSGRGLAEQAFSAMFLRQATIAANTRVGAGLRVIELAGSALRDVTWRPGDIVQVGMGGFKARSYTPFAWDRVTGLAKLLVATRAGGPGSLWAEAAAPGMTCEFFGPREALRLGAEGGTTLIFGDETSFALGVALQNLGAPAACFFEADAPEAARSTLSALGLNGAHVWARIQGDDHLDALIANFVVAARECERVVLSGKVGSIQRLRQALKRSSIVPARLASKAYWAPGKTGLD